MLQLNCDENYGRIKNSHIDRLKNAGNQVYSWYKNYARKFSLFTCEKNAGKINVYNFNVVGELVDSM